MATSAKAIVNAMMERDRFSQWLGIRVETVEPGRCIVSMTVRAEMVNGFGIAHGGIAFALADSALAFAANSHGVVALALSNAMSYSRSVTVGSRLVATAVERSLTTRTGTYDVDVHVGDELVAVFRGTVYRKSQRHGNSIGSSDIADENGRSDH